MNDPLDIILLTEEDSDAEENNALTGYMRAVAPRVLDSGQLFRWPRAPHLNIVALASALKPRGFSCELVDNFLTLPEKKKRLEMLLSRNPLAVGLSTTFILTEKTIREVSEMVRARAPGAKLIFGGATILQFPEFRRYGDITVLGEGERTLAEVLEALKSGGDLSRIDGIEFQRDGELIRTPPARLLSTQEIPYPDWSLLGHGANEFYLLETQRGCVYKCQFCTHPLYSPGEPGGSGVRLMPIDRVLDEIRRNYEDFGLKHYRIVDSTFTFPPARAREICRGMIRMGLPLRWSCYGRVDNMTPELASLMAEAGCRCIFFGVESGDDGMLRAMRKEFNLEDIHRGVGYSREAGIRTLGSFFIGYPGETEASVANTQRCLLETGFHYFRVNSLWLDHNAPVYGQSEKYRLVGKGGRWEHSTMNSEEAERLTGCVIRSTMVNNAARLLLGTDTAISTPLFFGLSYDESMQFIDARSLLLSYRLAKAEGLSLDPFDSAEVEEAKSQHRATLFKMGRMTRAQKSGIPV